MSWRKYLLVPVLALTAGGRRRPADAWEAYWGGVRRTGPEGDVLWDGAGEHELRWWAETARRHLDPALPVVDVGCGNGRLGRLLAGDFPSVLGVDLSPAAVEVARRESSGVPGLRFRQLDVTAPGAGAQLAAELGPANVVVRGVLHVLDPRERRRAETELRHVLGGSGVLLLLETNWRGDLLGYLEHLGGRRGRLPAAVSRLIEFGLPRPSAFGPDELARTFPAGGWSRSRAGRWTSPRCARWDRAGRAPSPVSTPCSGRRRARHPPVREPTRPNRACDASGAARTPWFVTR